MPISGKIVVLKDSLDNNIFPETSSQAVYTEDGKTVQEELNRLEGLIDENFQNVSNGKSLIAAAITDKGVPSSGDETFKDLSVKIITLDESNEKILSFNYSFENNDPGSGAGIISLKCKNDYYKGLYSIYWADANNQKIEIYSKICDLDLTTSNIDTKKMNECYLIPKGVDRLIAVRDDKVETYFSIPANKQISTEKKYSFGLLSDIHIDGTGVDKTESVMDFTRAMDHFQNTEKVDMVIVSGDVTKSGLTVDMVKFRELADSYQIPVHCSRGNHDTYNECTVENFTKYIDSNGIYYEMNYKGDIYLFLGLAIEDIANPFPDYGLDWLEQKLEEYKNQRVFLIQHVFVEPTGNPGSLYMFNEGLLNTEGTNAKRFRELVKKYRNPIHFSGHSHFDFSLERLNSRANIAKRTDNLCHRVHTPSGTVPRQVDIDKEPISDNVYANLTGSQGYVVDVYDDFIVLRGIDFPTNSYVMNAQYYLDTTPIEYEVKEEVAEYPFVENFTTYSLGTLTKTGELKEHTATKVTEFIRLNKNPNIGFACKGRIIYFRICYYDINKLFISYEDYFYNDVASSYHEKFYINKPSNACYIRFCAQEAIEKITFNGLYVEETVIPENPPAIEIPENTNFPNYESEREPADKIEKAKWKSLEFIKRQLNTSNFNSMIDFKDVTVVTEIARPGKDEPVVYTTKLLTGTISSLESPSIMFNKYISLDQIYDEQYLGNISGKWHSALKFPENYRVDVYVITDSVYYVDSCKLKEDNTWCTNRMALRGIKHIELVEINSGLIVEYGYPIVNNYKVKLFKYVDVEYLFDICNIYVYNNEYFFFSKGNTEENILGKVINYKENVTGITSKYSNISSGRLPSSYLIPSDDPNYDKEGNTALGKHGYLMNSRSFIYDVGLVLLVFTCEGQYDICKELINRIKFEQKEDGSFNFSYDNYIGQLYEDYIRTGSIGWLIWGICFYCLKSGDQSYNELLQKAGEWILSKQVKTDGDIRYGLLLGGTGSYDVDYNYTPVDIQWCSTEHNCSTLQALVGLYKVLKDERYKEAGNIISTSLINTLYDSTNNRFYQGVTPEGLDDAWAIDCLSWAGKVAYHIGRQDIAQACMDKINEKFLVENKSILVSSDKETYNLKYSLPEGTLCSGFKPYSDGYENNPELIWTEGTLGVIALLKKLNMTEQYTKYIDEMIKLQNCNSSTGGLIYTTETRSSIPWEFHVWESVVSSAWLYLVLTDEDVLFNISFD